MKASTNQLSINQFGVRSIKPPVLKDKPNQFGINSDETFESFDLTGAKLLCGSKLFVLVAGKLNSFDEQTLEATGILSVISSANLSLLRAPATLRIDQLELEIMVMQTRQAELLGEQSIRFIARVKHKYSKL